MEEGEKNDKYHSNVVWENMITDFPNYLVSLVGDSVKV